MTSFYIVFLLWIQTVRSIIFIYFPHKPYIQHIDCLGVGGTSHALLKNGHSTLVRDR